MDQHGDARLEIAGTRGDTSSRDPRMRGRSTAMSSPGTLGQALERAFAMQAAQPVGGVRGATDDILTKPR
jgi:hypothetical protein